MYKRQTPDYAEDTDVSNANLVLAGHTHGGQVSLFKKYSPVKHSIYGNRFLTGWKAVSYTHLDVYKRQLLGSGLPDGWLR